jgi:hypothetical protein
LTFFNNNCITKNGQPFLGLDNQKSKVKIQNDLPGGDGVREFALGIGADTGPSTGSGRAVAKACAV